MARSAANDPLEKFRFLVDFEGIGRAGFHDIQMPKRTTTKGTYREGTDKDINQLFAGLSSMEDIVMSRGVIAIDASKVSDFYKWVALVHAPSTGNDRPNARPAGSASNEYHYFDAAQFEQSDVPTSFDEARQIHLTLKATRINELHNPHFYNGVTAPWSLTNASTGVDLEATDPTQDNYDVYSKTIQSNKATIKLTTVHDFKAGDYEIGRAHV